MIEVAVAPSGEWFLTFDGNLIHFWKPDGQELRSMEVGKLLPHTAAGALAVSPDSTRLALGLIDGVDVIDATTATRLFSFRSVPDNVVDIAFSADGTKIAAGTSERTVRMWDLAGVSINPLLATYRGHESHVSEVSFHPSGMRLASVSREGIRIWDARFDPEVARLNTGGAGLATHRQSGRVMATGQGTWLQLVDPQTLNIVTRQEGAGHVLCADFSPDGKLLATGHGSGIQLWTVDAATQIKTIAGPNPNRLVFSSDGKSILAAYGDRKVRLWDVESSQEIAAQQLPLEAFCTTRIAGTSQVAYVVANRIVLWDTAKLDAIKLLPQENVYDFAVSADGRRFATTHAASSGVQVWDLASGELVAALPSQTRMARVAFHPDGTRIAASSEGGAPISQIIVWDLASRQELVTFRERGLVRFISALAFSPDGQYLAAQGAGFMRLWRAPAGQHEFAISGHGTEVSAIAYLPDGSGTGDRQPRSHGQGVGHAAGEHARWTCLATPKAVIYVAVNHDGTRIVSVESNDKQVRLWNAAGQQLLKFQGNDQLVNSVTFSRDGRRLAVVGDPQVRVFDAEKGTQLSLLVGHETPVAEAAFCADDRRLITVGGDQRAGEVCLWDLATGQCLSVSALPALVRAVAAEPGGERYATASDDGVLR